MGFSRQESWSGLPCPPPEDLLDPEIKGMSLTSPALAGGFFTTGATWEALPAACSHGSISDTLPHLLSFLPCPSFPPWLHFPSQMPVHEPLPQALLSDTG